MMDNDKKMAAWRKWLAERPESVRQVAERVVPWEKWAMRDSPESASFYVPVSYGEHEDGSVTLTVQRLNHAGVPLWRVFGVHPDDLIPYPYGDDNPVTPDRIAAEALMAGVALAEIDQRTRGDTE